MFGAVLQRLFWHTYDSLGAWIVLSLVASLAWAPLLAIPLWGASLPAPAWVGLIALSLSLAPLVWGGLLGAAARCEAGTTINLGHFNTDTRRFAKHSLLLGGLTIAVTAITTFNVLAMLGAGFTAQWSLILRLALMAFFFWIGASAFLITQLAWTFVALQDQTLGKAFSRAALIGIHHPVLILLATLVALVLTFLFGASVVGVMIFLPALLANLLMGTVTSVIEFYEIKEDREERARLEAEGVRGGPKMQALAEREATRMRFHRRRLREILRPWDMDA